MKKIIVIIIIFIGAALLYTMSDKSTTHKTITPTANKGNTFRPDPSNATFTFDDGPITLSKGKNETTIDSNSSLVEETALLDKFAYGDINSDGKEDTALFLVRSGGGSGTFIYLAAYVSGPITYRGSEAFFIGDRISPQAIFIKGGVVTINYLDRKPDEAFATEPTVPVSKRFVYKDGELKEK